MTEGHVLSDRKPNPWGLYDIHGNAAETLDGYGPYPNPVSENSCPLPTTGFEPISHIPEPSVVPGLAELQRAAARMGSDDIARKNMIPPAQKSMVVHRPARGVGFRLPSTQTARPMPSTCWKIDSESIEFDVTDRLDEGRGVLGIVDKDLPAAIQELRR